MKKSELLKINREIFEKLEKYKTLYDNEKRENAKLLAEIEALKTERKQEPLTNSGEENGINISSKFNDDDYFSEDAKYAASVIGKIIIKATEACNRITALDLSSNAKELVNLILGRTEVAKAEMLNIISMPLSLQEKKSLMNEQKSEAEDYFESVLAQN